MSALTMLTGKPWMLAGFIGAAAATGSLVAVHPWSRGDSSPVIHGSGSNVLGEKLTQPGATAAPSNNGNGGGNGNGNNGGKSFAISGNVNGLEPGSTASLLLTVANTNSQAITVTALSATLDHIDKAPGAPAGTCSNSNAGIVIHPWTGGSFTVAKNATAAAPGAIPIEVQRSSAPACVGATFWFSYSGSANQA